MDYIVILKSGKIAAIEGADLLQRSEDRIEFFRAGESIALFNIACITGYVEGRCESCYYVESEKEAEK